MLGSHHTGPRLFDLLSGGGSVGNRMRQPQGYTAKRRAGFIPPGLTTDRGYLSSGP